MNLHSIFPIIIWVVLIGAFIFFYFGGRMKKKKYEDRSMDITQGWYEQSQRMYGTDSAKKAYYFEYDKNYLTQGHLMVDHDRQTVYEAKILYGDPGKGYEADLTNHLINYTHHHKISATISTGLDSDGNGIATSSYFRFDGEDIWAYLESLGYSYKMQRFGLAYQINVSKDGANVGTVYSSNSGKNYFGCESPYKPKMGSKGFYIVECADRDVDAMFLYAMAFTRTELTFDNLK